MDVWLVIILVLFAVIGTAFAVRYMGGKRAPTEGGESGLLLLQRELQALTRKLDEGLSANSRTTSDTLRTHLNESEKVMHLVREITGELVRVREGQQKVTRDIAEELIAVRAGQKEVASFADQLQDLQNILKNPKQRGILGEYYLETVLKNVLPPGTYEMQYGFNDGTIVDAAIFIREKILPIDSKFSLENYNRLVEERDPVERERLEKQFRNDLKLRIDETAKYVRPKEGTLDFAFMFIPHEAVYYDLLISTVGASKVNTRDLIEYAFKEKHVIIVSPTSFLAYLQTVLQGLKALQIEDSVHEVIKRVGELASHLKKYEDSHLKLGNSLATVVNHYNASGKEFKKIDKDVLRITGAGVEVESLVIDKPAKEEE